MVECYGKQIGLFYDHELTWASKWLRGIIESLKPHPCDTYRAGHIP